MTNSILEDTKKILQIAPNYDVFDLDVITHINSALSVLNQLGIGPDDGFMIVDSTSTWDELLQGDARFNSVKTYVFLKVKMVFDPPTTSFVLTAMQDQLKELEWRLEVAKTTKG